MYLWWAEEFKTEIEESQEMNFAITPYYDFIKYPKIPFRSNKYFFEWSLVCQHFLKKCI